MFDFIPKAHPDLTISRITFSTIFAWFCVNTFWSILSVLLSDPGYIDKKYKRPLKADGTPPLEELRLFNMKTLKRNFLYDFSLLPDDEI